MRAQPKPSRRVLLLLAGIASLVIAQLGPAPAAADPGTILMYGPSIDGDTPNEQTVAEAGGHTVTVVSATQWSAMSTAQFAGFDALVIGDDSCDNDQSQLDAAAANRTTWSPAVTGNVTFNTFDPFAHEGDTDKWDEFVANSLNFAVSGPGTGLYFTLGCYFDEVTDPTTIELIDQFGTFTIDKESGDEVTILQPAHLVMAGLTNADLSNWGSSTHEHFLTFPSSFQVLAEETENVDPAQAVALGFTAPLPICKGKTATMFGESGNDVLVGTSGKDVIAGLEGNDQIRGAGGKDLICGGLGNDKLKGGGGNDTLLGQAGKDLLAGGGGGGDVCKGGPGKDTAKGNCEKGRA
jgi:RTX calcium-binding nonapeptide repeat (4 copies)